MMHSGLDEVTKQRMLQAKALSKEARGREFGCIHFILFQLLYISKHKHTFVN